MATHEHELAGYMSIRDAEQVCDVSMSIASSSKRRKHLLKKTYPNPKT
jgi:hypothetical protein